MRIFIAIEIPVLVKELVAGRQAKLREHTAGVTWTKPENLHLTLKFLGEIENERLPAIREAANASAQHVGPFSLTLGSVGVFPNARNPRVLWIGLSGDVDNAVRLAARLDKELVARGFAGEKRPFQPHLTIGRFKRPGGAQGLIALARDTAIPESHFAVEELIVMESLLARTGAEHTPVFRVRLR